MDSTTREVDHEFLPFVRVYKDGTVDRLIDQPHVPPSPSDPATGVSSKDITISPDTGVTARIYLPELINNSQKLPILVYFHGGGFLVGSPFSAADHHYINSLSFQAHALAISIDYRLAPQHPLPTAYQDCWSALQWIASHSNGSGDEPWLINHGDFNRVFIGGDSAGGNIAHNMAMQAGRERLPNGVRVKGAILAHPYFWSSDPTPGHEERLGSRLWKFTYPSSPGGLDDPMINPSAPGAPSLAGLGCSSLLVCAAEKDLLRDRNERYYEAVRDSGWNGEVEFYEAKGEEHVFHIFNPESDSTKNMIKHLVLFMKNDNQGIASV